MCLQAARNAHHPEVVRAPTVFEYEGEAEPGEAAVNVINDLDVCIADTEDSARVAALGVEDPGEKSLAPVLAGLDRPLDRGPDCSDARRFLSANRHHRACAAGSRGEREL